jgi:septal ring-binding cell division protein DamX
VVILLRGHGSAPENLKIAPLATPTAVDVAANAGPAPTIAVSPASTAPAVAVAAAPTRGRPTPAPATAVPTKTLIRVAPTASAASTVTTAREAGAEGSRQAWLDRAARDQQRARGDRKARFTIQLELACEIGSLVDAWKHDRPSGTMWLLSAPYQGRACFRVLWGRYPTREAARRAVPSVPAFFSTPRNRPIVTAIH